MMPIILLIVGLATAIVVTIGLMFSRLDDVGFPDDHYTLSKEEQP